MDPDTVWTVVKIILFVLATFLILWAYNAYCVYRFLYDDIKTHDEPVITVFTGREPGSRFDCAYSALLFGLALPKTQKQLFTLWYHFFPPKPPRDEDVPMLE